MAQLLDSSIETFVKFNKRVGGPQFPSEFFSCDYFPGLLQQNGENPKRLILKAEQNTVSVNLTHSEIDLEESKGKAARPVGWDLHRSLRGSARSLPQT